MEERRDLVLYDGACGLCAASVQFVLRRDHRAHFVYAPLQGPRAQAALARHGREVELNTFVLVTDYEGEHERIHDRSRAALAVLARLSWGWRVLGALGSVIPRALADRVYDLVAKNRHRLFGAERCLIPDPAHRSRFLEAPGAR